MSAAMSSSLVSAGPVGPRPSHGMWHADVVLVQARALLADAQEQSGPADRFRIAHLAALRAAAALLLTVGTPGRRPAPRPTSAWLLIDRLLPDFRQWSDYFAARAAQRAAADAGATGAVTAAQAAEMLAAVPTFLALVDAAVTDAALTRAGVAALPDALSPAGLPPPGQAALSAAS